MTIRGVDFVAHPIVLNSIGMDLILGMSWLAKYDAVIQCSKRAVLLVAPSGEKIECQATKSSEHGQVNHAEGTELKDIRVVNEYPDVFPDELPGMPPEREVECIGGSYL